MEIKPVLSFRDLVLLVHAFIFTQLLYCNSIFFCLNQAILLCLQFMQNAAARLQTKTSCSWFHISPILASPSLPLMLNEHPVMDIVTDPTNLYLYMKECCFWLISTVSMLTFGQHRCLLLLIKSIPSLSLNNIVSADLLSWWWCLSVGIGQETNPD